MNTYLLISGGTVSKSVFEAVLLEYSFYKIIACDKGIEACNSMNIIPDVVIGDFDSADRTVADSYRDKCEFVDLDIHKDFTDTHAAINYIINEIYCDCNNGTDTGLSDAVKGDAQNNIINKYDKVELIILGATGTRLDHTMANIGMLKLCLEHNIQACIIDEHNRIRMIDKECTLCRDKLYPYVSLIPYSEKVCNVKLTGFEYPVSSFTFVIGDSIGVSNSIVEDKAAITLDAGKLLVIESHD
jgi:thiamine pyrophosphokinase